MKELKEDTLGQRIKAQRIRIGMTQEELAEEMCTTKSMISYYENDHGDMKLSLVAEFANVLCTTIDYLVCGEIKNQEISNEEKEVLFLLKRMDAYTRGILLIQIRAIVNKK